MSKAKKSIADKVYQCEINMKLIIEDKKYCKGILKDIERSVVNIYAEVSQQ